MDRSHSTWPQAARIALAGIWVTVCRERNMRIHLWILTLVSLLELVLRPPLRTVVMIVGVSAFVLATELVNSAIETAVDLTVGSHYHPLAKIAKDSAAGAALIAAFAAVMAGILFLVEMWPWRVRLVSTIHMAAAVINAGIVIVTFAALLLSRNAYQEYRQYGNEGKGGNLRDN